MNKYRNTPTIVDGIRFASKAEAKRYQQLKLLERGKVISELMLQPRYPLHVEGKLICTYVADFSYNENDNLVIEDVKGFKTPEFNIKSKLFEAIYGQSIVLIGVAA